MFELQITDMSTARAQYFPWAHRIISILDPELEGHWEIKDDQHLVLHFDDVEREEPQMILAEAEDVERILDHARPLKPGDRFLVHCHAGVSRSTASAIAVLIDHGKSIEDAFEQVRTLRGLCFWPNQRIIRLADDQLGLGGKLDSHVISWKMDQQPDLIGRSDDMSTVFLDRLAKLGRLVTNPAGA